MNIIKPTVAALFTLALAGQALAADAVIATVNNKPIKQALVDFIIKDASDRGQKVDDSTRDIVVSKLISSELVAQEAQRVGLDKQPDYLLKEELARRELLVNSFIQDT
jgi:peptidyl-prolyl cis-trans isomerase C